IVDEARLAVFNLRRSERGHEDLPAAVSRLSQRVGLEAGVPVRFESTGACVTFGPEQEQCILMLIREALYNAVRHAAPRSVSVAMRFEDGSLQVRVEDDGCGFDPAIAPAGGGHFGLIGMRERVQKLGGEFQLTSARGKGTQVMLRVPWRAPV
ncbi:MAG: sensor histidine kinase, partial [Bryobacteraceae bacterium]